MQIKLSSFIFEIYLLILILNILKKLSFIALAITILTYSCKEKVAEVKVETKKEVVKEVKEVTGFSKVLTYGKFSYKVQATDNGSLNKLNIQPSGLETNQPITMEIDGTVTGAESEDLNGDGFPEILVFVSSAGSGAYGTVICYSPNNGKSLSQAYFPETANSKKLSKGYMGHDVFDVVENTLTQQFPIYKEGDTNAEPTGKRRLVSYNLVNGESSRKFVINAVDEY